MAEIPNFPEELLDRHHAWHQAGVHPQFPTRTHPKGTPGSGLEFLVFHREFIKDFHRWYDVQDFADQSAVAPWPAVPGALQRPELGWPNWAGQVDRIENDPLSFKTEDELGIFIETGVHDQFLHAAAALVFNEPGLGQLHSPQFTEFYGIHGLVQKWWDGWRRWLHGVPGAASDVPVAQGTSPTSWYTTPENVQHIAYVGTDQKIHELFFLIR